MNKRFILGQTSSSALLYILLGFVIPIATLVVAGLVFLWQNSLLLLIAALWLFVTAIAYAALVYWPKLKAERRAKKIDTDQANTTTEFSEKVEHGKLPQQLQARDNWTTKDLEVWDACCSSIETQLQEQPEWQSLPDLAIEQLALISEQYHGSGKNAQFQFTVPEVLLVISITSSRYRQLVLEHVPFIDKISIATGGTLFDQKENIGTGYKWFSRLRRSVRLLNPASAVVGELRELISNKLFAQVSTAVQNDLKRLLLQEAVQVGIDLYSGKLSVSDDELASYTSQAARNDEKRRADTSEPIRILLLGQTSVGKSSLVNALTKELQAEVDVLPVTNQQTVHELHMNINSSNISDRVAIASLIDTPGNDGTAENIEHLLNAALEADLILWVAKATQPARAPDQQLHAAIQSYYAKQNEKLQPPVILALTHIDQLSPKPLWAPPYDLLGTDAKAQSIAAAIVAAQSGIGLSEKNPAIPVYVGDAHEHYNVDALASQIMMLIDASTNVQLNRRRLELRFNAYDWQARWTQTKKLGRVVGQSIVRAVKQ